MYLSPTSQRVYHANGSALTVTTVANTLYATPFLVGPYGFTPDQIGFRVTVNGTGGGNNMARLGIYEDTALGSAYGPGNLVADFGSTPLLTTNGGVALDIRYGAQVPTKFLSPNKAYWLAALFGAAGGTQVTVAGIGSTVSTFGIGHELGVAGFALIPVAAAGTTSGVTASVSFGPLPAVCPPVTYVSTTMPVVGLRHI